MTIVEIKETLDKMSMGSKAHFYRYMVSLGMFNDEKLARTTFYDYLNRKPNSSSFIKRQQICDVFQEWRYKYGSSIKTVSKGDLAEKYNEKLREVWKKICV